MCVLKGVHNSNVKYKGRPVYVFDKKASKLNSFFSGTALFFTIIPTDAGKKTIAHEHGHHIQGNYWGWLYLPVIGISSIRNNLKSRTCYKTWENYYKLYPEAQADRLGGVVWVNGERVYKGAA